ncbi:MAG TPA: tetratricopeptide repeat protein, partial [Candidatus Saccharimonadales bacterium]|nr:tetratricopeptide repeat protein [Candidatus Saccharimonadales bacterium]
LDARLGGAFRDPGALAAALEPEIRKVAAAEGYDDLLARDSGPQKAIRSAVEEGLASLGLSVDSIEKIGIWPEIVLPDGDAGAAGPRILIVGLDGADWRILDPLMARGLMPNLSRIVKEGVRARLRTITPTLSPIIWTSIATGKVPEKHGILDFLAVDSRTGREMPVTSTMRKVRAFWQILSGEKISVGTVGWWATWPAEPVLGFQVSDRVAYQLFGAGGGGAGLKGRTWPEGLMLALAPEIQEASGKVDADLEEVLGRPPDPGSQDESALRQILTSTRTYHRAALDLIGEYHPRVAAVYYEGTDTVAHLFMRYAPPRLPGVDPSEVERWGGVLDRYCVLQDRLLGELVAAAGEGTIVMVISDHGFKSGSTRPQTDPRIGGGGGAADWHRKFGIFAVSGPGIRRGSTLSDVSVLDITPTLLALLGLPPAKDMDGRVIDAIRVPGSPPVPPAIATWEGAGKDRPATADATDPASREVEQEIISKLTALGYLGQTTPNASNNAGITLLRQGRNQEAERAFREAWEKDPGFLPARVNMARAKMADGRMDDALTDLEAVRRADPNLPDVENLIGNVMMEKNELQKAESVFEGALKKSPRDPHLWNSLGIVLARRGLRDRALEAYRRVVSIDPDYAEAINNAGLVYRDEGRLDEAIGEFEKAIRADPDFPGSYNNLGLVYQDRGQIAEALRAYDRGLKADPENAVIWNNRGSALLKQGKRDEAADDFRRAIESDATYASAHNNLGAVLGMLGDPNGEFEEYLKAIDLDPNYTDARLNLSLNLIKRGRLREATRSLRQLLDIDPGHSRALLELGVLLLREGQEDEGVGYLRKAREAEPGWTAPRNALARYHLARGLKAQALEEARESLALDPNQPEIRSLIAEAGGSTSGSKP